MVREALIGVISLTFCGEVVQRLNIKQPFATRRENPGHFLDKG
jgi:hypothetical protein